VPACLPELSEGSKSIFTIPADYLNSRTAVPACLPELSEGSKSIPTIPEDYSHSKTAVPACLPELSEGSYAIPTIPADYSHSKTAVPACLPELSEGSYAIPSIGADDPPEEPPPGLADLLAGRVIGGKEGDHGAPGPPRGRDDGLRKGRARTTPMIL
jgi:hypothetical protein